MALKTIRLYGRLGAQFGRVHRLDVQTCSEAIRALCVLIDGFEHYMRNAKKNGIRFAVFKGKENITAENLVTGLGDREFRIAPIAVGAKKGGLFQTILGAVMVVVGVAITFGTAGTMSTFGAYLAMTGASFMLGGVMQMLSPQPQGMSQREDTDNKPSYAFGQPVNTTAQGNPVGVLWGYREIGGAVLSAGIIANEVRN